MGQDQQRFSVPESAIPQRFPQFYSIAFFGMHLALQQCLPA
jgi:hypothetical protein